MRGRPGKQSLLPELDQRIGFVDYDGGQATLYYYLADPVGSVQQIVREDGEVVNQYGLGSRLDN